MSATLLAPAVTDDPGYLDRLAGIFERPAGLDRAAAAHLYSETLSTWAEEVKSIRDVELARVAETAGPTQVGKALGVGKERGYQLLKRAAERHGLAQHVVSRLRRRVLAERRSQD